MAYKELELSCRLKCEAIFSYYFPPSFIAGFKTSNLQWHFTLGGALGILVLFVYIVIGRKVLLLRHLVPPNLQFLLR